MPWLKRNLFLVVGGVIALSLLGLAGFFLYTKIQLNQEVTDKLNTAVDQLKGLATRDPHPGTESLDNISAAQQEAKKLEKFLGEVRRFFPQTVSTNEMTTREFRALLDQTVDDLQKGAERAGVKLPSEDYWFTFSAQKSTMNFATNTVTPLAGQLIEIHQLCDILYKSKVIALHALRRSAVGSEETGYTDYLTNKPVTNAVSIASPYEVTFEGFSSEVASVMEGLIKSPICFVVKNIYVGQAEAAQAADQESTATETPLPGYNPYSRYGNMMRGRYGGGMRMDPSMAQRYGLPGATPGGTPPPAKKGKGGVSTLLEEKLLRVVLTVDVVKLNPQNVR